MIVKKTIDLDMSRRLVNDTIRLHEGDVNGTALVLNVTDNGTPFDLTGCTAKFDAVIGNYLAEADGVATISDSTITVPITPQMTVINGLLKIDVKIIKGGSILFFQTLEMNVQRRVIQGDEQIDLDGTTIGQKLELLDELFKNPPEKRLEVYDNDLDYADKNDTVYVHKVHSGTGSYVKGIVLVAGDDPAYQGCTQYRLRKSGSVEYRTGTLNTTTDPYSYDWSYTATGNWKRLATLDDIPDIPEVVNPWKNKTYISHGDSITWQDGKDYGSGTHQGETARGYQTVLKELLELGTYTNKGVNGATLADRAGVSVSGVSTIKSIASYASYGLCTIAFGTNDFKQGVPLGTLGAATDTVFNTTTFFGAFREAVKYILTSSPTIRLVLMTPLQRDQHDYNVDTVNTVGLKLRDYVNAVKLIGKMYGLPVCDLYSNSGITELTLSTYTIDGLHPNDEGFKRIGEVLADTLTTGGNNDAEDLSGLVQLINAKMSLAPLNPTMQEIAALPSGQLYSDTTNHKGVVKDGQEFYDASKIDSMLLNYVKNSALDSAITDFYIGLINPPVLNSPPPGKAQTGDLYDIGTVIGYTLPITFSSTVTIYFVLKDITFGLNRYNYNWQRLGGSHSFKLRTGVPVSTLNYDDTFTPPLKVGDTAVKDPYNPSAKRTYYVLENVITSTTEMTFVWTEVPIHKTTLSGYGITNAYTKTEIDQKGYLTLETLPIYEGTVI